MSMLLIDRPFERIALDIAVPFTRSNAGYQYILVMIEYDMRFLDMTPLKNSTAPKAAEELIKWISRASRRRF